MASVNIAYDTKTKAIAVTIDGNAVDNLSCIEFYKSYSKDGEFRFGLSTALEDEDEGTVHVTRVMAADLEAGTPGTTEVVKKDAPAAAAPKPDVALAISEYLKKKGK